ncbi:luciferase family oxidoreductase group 1 [Litorimonas taeanensis]|uniref:Luciferase-like monooxygenase n=1 Tax=Litorimonas taeanensis TaxID=568099 RepID=A0A420WDN8_9PROT|nr:LLM class flavin-dependent oxidoreductase [Litorimonas taeanensis]RKQ69030.1 luciferase family oxidoreductase group 1 [Litorimonas taeanensis]
MTVPFSILDLAQVTDGGSIAKSFEGSVALAQKAEALNFKRVWYAEHHNIASVASSATSVLIAHIAAHTKSIRLGAGGIMLPNHAPLLIAEQFGTLATLHPGRIDLGVGRAPGGDMGVIRAMRKDYERAGRQYPSDVEELIGYLAKPDETKTVSVRAIPGEGTEVPVWILGSSLYGAQLAAKLGLPYAFASHFAPTHLFQAAEIYRREFKPSAHLTKPYFMMACNVFAADSEEEAKFQFSTLVQAFTGILTNNRGLTRAPVEDFEVPAHIAPQLQAMLQVSAVGTVETIAKRLSYFLDELQLDEIIIAKNFYDQTARLRSLELTKDVHNILMG